MDQINKTMSKIKRIRIHSASNKRAKNYKDKAELMAFKQELLSMLTIDSSKNTLPELEKVLEGDIHAITRVFSKQMGLEENLIGLALNSLLEN